MESPTCDGDVSQEGSAENFRWQYPDSVKPPRDMPMERLSEMIIEEARRRFPAVAEYLSLHERRAKDVLSDAAPEDCSFHIGACEMREGGSADMVATMECYDQDVYRHWDYTSYDAVFADGNIAFSCVPEGKSLADVLPSFPTTPVLVIQKTHLSGECGPGHQYMHNETITLCSIVKPLRGIQEMENGTR